MISRRIVAPALALGLAALLSLGAFGAPASAEEFPGFPSPPPSPPVEETNTLLLSPSDAVTKPGVPVTFEVTVLASEGGAPLDPQPELTYTLGTDAAGDVVDGLTVTATSSGPRAVFVRSGAQYGVTELTVVGDPVALQITPSAPSVAKGGSLTFTVTGVDDWGTPIDGSAAVLTSSVGTDVVNGQTVTFPTASPHTITATIGGVTASVTVEVVAPATAKGASAELAETGVAPLHSGLVAAILLLAGAAISVLTIARRRVQHQ
ncbi:hypothetical protein DCE93_12590 [Agromyces badenianii]|uniref:Uncharacterized protein n=1 Tax=Agromyces badenianii TaxID=2080742 RepID=A0A2S0WYN5_9MICO|nr:hypothetical protein [Agromyces badenianii]AWB96382.1 hypothetical protein DCE93_12590 [Agromyces badenianii]PWC05246.1 hypothetical protein DCE94_02815 [Agromyces badenianii]